MPWIANYSLENIRNGRHLIENGNTVLIRISGAGTSFPDHKDVPYRELFSSIHQFDFQDNEDFEEGAMTVGQAEQIVEVLSDALDNGQNVVVHCVMGLSRSGAVAEAGTLMGFEDLGIHRIPNVHVKALLLKSAGYYNSWDPE